ncbi:MAG: AIR synthase related protein, partial [Pseudohongiellaceae bacterium]
MSLSEFEIISRYFNQSGLASAPDDSNIPLGIGDDCALIKVPQQHRLAVSMDLLCAGVHFPREAAPDDIATRALAVNLSDLAAMGATPAGFTLGLSLPVCEPVWLESFSEGLKHLAQRYRCPLIGGDITRGESLVIAIQVHGYVHEDFALYRHGARPGD